MFDWLFEGRLTVYLALGVAALILVAMWRRDRKRGWLVGIAVVVALMPLNYGLDRLVETGREQIGRKLQEMAAGVKARSADRIFRHVSERFTFQGMNRAAFRSYVEGAMRNGFVNDLVIYDVHVPDDTGRVTFRAVPKGSLPGTGVPYLITSRFVKESGGEWRLESFEIADGFGSPLNIPQLPR